MPGNQGPGTREGQQFPGWAGQPERRGEAALQDDPAIKGSITPASLPAGFLKSGKCTSYFGFGLVLGSTPAEKGRQSSDEAITRTRILLKVNEDGTAAQALTALVISDRTVLRTWRRCAEIGLGEVLSHRNQVNSRRKVGDHSEAYLMASARSPAMEGRTLWILRPRRMRLRRGGKSTGASTRRAAGMWRTLRTC